jgi:hypothetical protein
MMSFTHKKLKNIIADASPQNAPPFSLFNFYACWHRQCDRGTYLGGRQHLRP